MKPIRTDGIDPAARSRARRRALQALYAWQLAGNSIPQVIHQFQHEQDMEVADQEYFEALVKGVAEHRADLDAKLAGFLDRPGIVERHHVGICERVDAQGSCGCSWANDLATSNPLRNDLRSEQHLGFRCVGLGTCVMAARSLGLTRVSIHLGRSLFGHRDSLRTHCTRRGIAPSTASI